ncbi:GDSL lipase acylhydrolase family protein [Mycena indigotica]|uniref:GDSL lipase acylhydrolase family protein n=1 Tax=Mycena indigotica TaxID=2126181 RepID=A0A8H6VV45_9AGAR|nr:GDSL lipase acylhydrolase family protein [Mycena indigotica]KAF7295064.1 GDSL lipase acylhydrolase family protein [Mycena indigotica]
MAAPVYDAIVLFGDSITQAGWTDSAFGAKLANVYSRKLDVLNRGLAGYNTTWALPVLEQCLERGPQRSKTRLIVIWFGANDACIKPSVQHVPLVEFIANIKQMVRLVQEADPETKVILITPPPVNTQQRKEDLESREPPIMTIDRDFEVTQQYAGGVLKAGADCNVPVVNVWVALWQAAGNKEDGLRVYLSDGLHLTRAGYEVGLDDSPTKEADQRTIKVVYDALLERIRASHGELDPEKLPSVFANWTEMSA